MRSRKAGDLPEWIERIRVEIDALDELTPILPEHLKTTTLAVRQGLYELSLRMSEVYWLSRPRKKSQ